MNQQVCRVRSLIIGTEILTGKTRDINSHVVSKLCTQYGLFHDRSVTVHDTYEDIREVIDYLTVLNGSDSQQMNLIITAGGCGPTHDDITYESVAKYTGDRLEHHKPTMNRMAHYMALKNSALNEGRKRMALFPSKSMTWYMCNPHSGDLQRNELADKSVLNQGQYLSNFNQYLTPTPQRQQQQINPLYWVPVVMTRLQSNFTMLTLPGIPSLFEAMLNGCLPFLIDRQMITSTKRHHVRMKCDMMEGDIADRLRECQRLFENKVQISSYPQWSFHSNDDVHKDQKSHKVMLTFTAANEEIIRQCIDYLSKNGITLYSDNDQ
ncbi:hypothetical protein MP228_006156 [Amoeboaphelidium protococcarum]|nr:hypothetical protein MP228_006156 [Amoeboaphelidium protococcarum]